MSRPVAIVTGGSSGIGQAICVALAHTGYQLVVVGRDSQRIEQTLALLPSSETHLGLSLDVTQEEQMQQMAEQTITAFGQIDVLIASAGVGRSANSDRFMPYPTTALPLAEWNAILDVNLKGVFLSNRAVLPLSLI
ncbi:MAG: SDR family oxidoreductase, partial [Leptolyngbyaceae cyanobacterium]